MHKSTYYLFGLFLFIQYSQAQSQSGINTKMPQQTLHTVGDIQLNGPLYVGGNADTLGNEGREGDVLKSGGPGQPAYWDFLMGAPMTGTVMVVNGKYLVAQEITVQMSADYLFVNQGSTASPLSIGNLDVVIMDNDNAYTGSAGGNSFTVVQSGVYLVMINMQLSLSNNSNSGNTPALGIWEDTPSSGFPNGKWVARVNDRFVAPSNETQTYTLITAINLDNTKTYSFRVSANSTDVTVKALSSGSTGEGAVSQVWIKRLR